MSNNTKAAISTLIVLILIVINAKYSTEFMSLFGITGAIVVNTLVVTLCFIPLFRKVQ